MPVASPYEKRRGPRQPHHDSGAFYRDDQMTMLRLCDVSERGVGALSRESFARGDRGLLSAKLPFDDLSRRHQVEVRWCADSDDPESGVYSYRVGFSLVSPSDAASGQVVSESPEKSLLKKTSSYRVKGSMLIDFAKMIRRNHDKPWHKYITMDDMQIINDMIIPAARYPLDTFRRAGLAVFEIFGNCAPESAREWGRQSIDRIPEQLYKSFFDKPEPEKAIKNYVNVNGKAFDFLRLRFNDAGERKARISFHGEAKVKEEFPELELVGLIFAGALEELAKRNGAKNPQAIILTAGGLENELLGLEITWS